MAHQPLQHYLRTYRRRSGLSQEEVARLLGATTGTKVSRYENFKRQPAVITVFAYEIIFNRPVRDLFAGTYATVCRDVRARAARLVKTLVTDSPNPRVARKIELLRTIVESASRPIETR